MNIAYQILENYFEENKTILITIVMIGFLLNIIQTNGITYATSNIIDSFEHNKMPQVSTFYAYFVGFSIVYIIIYYLNKHLQVNVLSKLTQWMRKEFIRYIFMQNNEEMSQKGILKYNSLIDRSSYTMAIMLGNLLNTIIPNATFILVIVGVFLYANVYLGLGFIICNIVLGLYIAYVMGTFFEFRDKYERLTNHNTDFAIDMFNNFDKIIYRGTVDEELENYNGRFDECISSALDYYNYSNTQTFIMMSIVYITIIGFIWYLIQLRSKNAISIQVLITFITLIMLYRERISNLIQSLPEYIDFKSRIDFVINKLDEKKFDVSSWGEAIEWKIPRALYLLDKFDSNN